MVATVFVVDDDPAVRAALKTLLESAGIKVECYVSAEAFLDAYEPTREGCLILDVQMPGMDGMELQRLLWNRCTCLPIIIVTGHGDVPLAVQAVKQGAIDVLEKPLDSQVLLALVRDAMELSRRLQRRSRQRSELAARLARLTPREREVITMLAEGHTTKMIARLLGLSPKTVHVHRARIIAKMEVESTAALVRLMQHVDLPELR